MRRFSATLAAMGETLPGPGQGHATDLGHHRPDQSELAPIQDGPVPPHQVQVIGGERGEAEPLAAYECLEFPAGRDHHVMTALRKPAS